MLGFPLALVFSWAFEITPEGIKLESEVEPNKSIRRRTGRKLIGITAALAIIATGLMIFQLARRQPASGLEGGAPATPDQSLAGARPSISAKSIAVLPFDNLSREPDNAYFCEGVPDEILTRL